MEIMKSVFKYAIPMEDDFSLELPKGGSILTVQAQHGSPQIWVLVDSSAPSETRRFCIVITGHLVEDRGKYIGTFQLDAGSFVGHFFEIK